MVTEKGKSKLGDRFTQLVVDVMERSNCYSKTVNVTARLLKCLFDHDRSRIMDSLTVMTSR